MGIVHGRGVETAPPSGGWVAILVKSVFAKSFWCSPRSKATKPRSKLGAGRGRCMAGKIEWVSVGCMVQNLVKCQNWEFEDVKVQWGMF